MLILLLSVHLYFTIHYRFIQKRVGTGIRLSLYDDRSKEKGFSNFGALATTLAATLGTGNIVGVSTAVFLGGPGAVFWCFVTGALGMATTYAECLMGNHYHGGPMIWLRDILHKKKLAVIYASFLVLSAYLVGCTTQSNAIALVTKELFKAPTLMVGLITATLIGFVITRGSKLIQKVCGLLVPTMALFFFGGCILYLILNCTVVPKAIATIFQCAFSTQSLFGGVIGYSLSKAIRYGIARGLFTNEAGLGTATIIAGDSNAKPEEQALISMSATFWDTVVLCSVTGIMIVTFLLQNPAALSSISSGSLTSAAFGTLPFAGAEILGIATILFAIATLIGWSYIGNAGALFLGGEKGSKVYQVIYLVMIFIGAVASLDVVWELTDFINLFLLLPSIFALMSLHLKKSYADSLCCSVALYIYFVVKP